MTLSRIADFRSLLEVDLPFYIRIVLAGNREQGEVVGAGQGLDLCRGIGGGCGAAERAAAGKMVEAMSIATPSLGTKALSLSGGNQQKVVIGKWLNSQVKILLMDEPTRGIDIHAKEQVYHLVRELAAQGISVIFVSSEIEEVLGVADRILVLNQGRISAEMPAIQADLETILALAMKEEVAQ